MSELEDLYGPLDEKKKKKRKKKKEKAARKTAKVPVKKVIHCVTGLKVAAGYKPVANMMESHAPSSPVKKQNHIAETLMIALK